MKILVVHNTYIHRGGEEACIDREVAVLRSANVQIEEYRAGGTGGLKTITSAALAPFGLGQEGKLEALIQKESFDVLHAHNLYPLFSPRVFRAAKRKGIKTVLTLHNYRPLCLNGLFLTPKIEVCQRCKGGAFWHGVVRGCYRKSPLQSLALGTHLNMAKAFQWYWDADRFIAPSRFIRDQFVQAGWPAEKITIQGHFLPDISPDFQPNPKPYILYLGRLSEEKGLLWLLNAFSKTQSGLTLKVAGEGPLQRDLEKYLSPTIQYEGFVTGGKRDQLLKEASALVLPSRCYENFPLAIIEANQWGTPVIASALGGMTELLSSGKNGWVFPADDLTAFENLLKTLVQKSSPDYRAQCHYFAKSAFSKERFLKDRLSLYRELAH